MTRFIAFLLLFSIGTSLCASTLPHVFNNMGEWTMEMEEEEKGEEQKELDDDQDEYWTNCSLIGLESKKHVKTELTIPFQWLDHRIKLISPPPER